MYSYDEILSKMVSTYEELSGFKLYEESDIMLRLRVLSSELFNSYNALEFVKRQMFVEKASGEYLDNHALERGIYRKSGVKAKGEVTFMLDSPVGVDIVIDKGCVVSTGSVDVKTFETTDAVVLKAGTLSVKAKVEATKEGSAYNVMKNTVNVMVTPPLYVSSVTNEMYFTGGSDRESDDDLRKRVIDSYKDISNGTNEVYYKRLVQSIDGIYSSSVVSSVRGNGTIDIYVGPRGEREITKDNIAKAQALVDENRELNVDALVLYATPKEVYITFSLEVLHGYDFDTVSGILKEKIKDHIDSLGVGNPMYICELSDVIYHTEGVKKFNFINAYSTDVYVKENEYCKIDAIEIRAVS